MFCYFSQYALGTYTDHRIKDRVRTESVVEVVVLTPQRDELDDEVEMTEDDEGRWKHRLRLVLQDQAVALELPHLERDRVHTVERVAATEKTFVDSSDDSNN